MIEFSLLLLLLVLLAVGISDVSAGLQMKHLLTQAAREGARIASVTPNLQNNDPRVLDVVDDIVGNAGVDPKNYTRGVRFPSRSSGEVIQPGDPVAVTITYNGVAVSESALSPLAPSYQIQADSTMRYEMRTNALGTGAIPQAPCNCTAWVAQGCGQGECSQTQSLFTRSCSPQGCDSTDRCRSVSPCAPPRPPRTPSPPSAPPSPGPMPTQPPPPPPVPETSPVPE